MGSYLKDLRLTFYLGDVYREYASRVAGYPGVFFGPLGKWPTLESAATDEKPSLTVAVQRSRLIWLTQIARPQSSALARTPTLHTAGFRGWPEVA